MRLTVAVTVCIASLLVLSPAASAERFLSKRAAQSNARDDVSKRYADYGLTYEDTTASCRPQFRSYDPRYDYEKWVCTWRGIDEEGDICKGTLRIRGRVGERGFYASRVVRGIRCYYA